MRRYETVIIADPELSEAQLKDLFEKFKNLITRFHGNLIKIENWGLKNMAFEVNHKRSGHYVIFEYCGNPDIVEKIEHNIKIDDRIIRFLTIKTSDKINELERKSN